MHEHESISTAADIMTAGLVGPQLLLGGVQAVDLLRAAHNYRTPSGKWVTVHAPDSPEDGSECDLTSYVLQGTAYAQLQLIKPGPDYRETVGYLGLGKWVFYDERFKTAVSDEQQLQAVSEGANAYLDVQSRTGSYIPGVSSGYPPRLVEPRTPLTSAIRSDLAGELPEMCDSDFAFQVLSKLRSKYYTDQQDLSGDVQYFVDQATTAVPLVAISNRAKNERVAYVRYLINGIGYEVPCQISDEAVAWDPAEDDMRPGTRVVRTGAVISYGGQVSLPDDDDPYVVSYSAYRNTGPRRLDVDDEMALKVVRRTLGVVQDYQEYTTGQFSLSDCAEVITAA